MSKKKKFIKMALCTVCGDTAVSTLQGEIVMGLCKFHTKQYTNLLHSDESKLKQRWKEDALEAHAKATLLKMAVARAEHELKDLKEQHQRDKELFQANMATKYDLQDKIEDLKAERKALKAECKDLRARVKEVKPLRKTIVKLARKL